MLIPGIGADRLREYGQQCCRIVRQPDAATGAGLSLTASIGSAQSPSDADTAWELMHRAGVAQFCAKSSGRDRALSFKRSLSAQIETRVAACVREGNFSLHYQPIVTLTEPPRLAGFEAFLRWRHPARGLIFPADFHAVLEEPRIARLLGTAALVEAIAQVRRWIDAGIAFGRVGLNLSTVQLREEDLASEILALFATHRVAPDRLSLELPEDIYLLADLGPVRATLERLRAAGVHLAVDGWAQGEFGFEALLGLPIQELKLDRALVQDPAAEDRLAHTIARARTLGVTVTAEGVETALQRQRLADLGCGQAQGWRIGRPMAAARVPAFVARLAGEEAKLAA